MIDSTSKEKFLTSKLFLTSNNYIAILDKECYTIKGMIEKDNINEKIKQQKNYLIELKTELNNLKFNSNNRSLEICKRKIGENINTLIDDLNDLNEEEIKEMKKTIKKEIEDLKEISNENSNSLYGTKVNLKGEKEIIFGENVSKELELNKIMLDYATCRELVMKRIKLRVDREKMKNETEIEKFRLNSLLNYINTFENRALGDKDNKIIDNILRAKLMLKLCSINYELVKDFFKVLRERYKRNEISKKEYEYCNNYSLTTEIIQLKFDPNDIIYLFFLNLVRRG